MKIRLYDTLDGVTVLGPGIRYVIWVQGCDRLCPGCMTPQSRPRDGGYEADTRKLAGEILNSGREGITISGGEPFLQAEALSDVLLRVRSVRDIGVIAYTGYTYADLRSCAQEEVLNLLGQCDLLIDGVYVEEWNDGKGLRGSSNQQVIPLTNRYRRFVTEYETQPSSVEFFYTEEQFRMVGIPPKDMLERLRKTNF